MTTWNGFLRWSSAPEIVGWSLRELAATQLSASVADKIAEEACATRNRDGEELYRLRQEVERLRDLVSGADSKGI